MRLDPKVKQWCGTNTHITKWGPYLKKHSALSRSPLSEEPQCLLGPVTYTIEKQEELIFEPLVADSPYREGRARIPEDAWYTNGSNKSNNHLSYLEVGRRLDPKAKEWCGRNAYTGLVGCLLTAV